MHFLIENDDLLQKYNGSVFNPEVFLKECKYIEKKVIRHINDNLVDFSSDDAFDNSDEELFFL